MKLNFQGVISAVHLRKDVLFFLFVALGLTTGGNLVTAADQSGADSVKSVEITANKLDFDHDTITISADQTLELTLINEGFVNHNFYVEALDWKLNTIEPDNSTTKRLEVSNMPEPGQYTFMCDVATHHKAGMIGKLVVTEADES